MNTEPPFALLFPGQGEHNARMIDCVMRQPTFGKKYEVVCSKLGEDLFKKLNESGGKAINQNKLSSVAIVFVSSLYLDHFKNATSLFPKCVGGYSVGELTALYAAGCFDFEKLIEIIIIRSDLMDTALSGMKTGMLSVIGVDNVELEKICVNIRQAGGKLWVSNYNSPGQVTLSGLNGSIMIAITRLKLLEPKRINRLSISGSWHCPLLEGAAVQLQKYLSTISFQKPSMKVVDNVTGKWLPDDPALIKEQLSKHLFFPVRWVDCIKNMMACNIKTFIEIGHGSLLTKFGFFIDRRAKFQRYDPATT